MHKYCDANPPYNPNACHREERSDVVISDTGWGILLEEFVNFPPID